MSQTKAQLIDAVDGSIVTADLADDAVNAAKLASNAVVNASVDASAAIAGSKINPSFTSNITVTNTAPALVLVDSDHNSDFNIQASGGLLNFNDSTNSATRISITSDGKVNFGTVARVEVDGVFKAAHGSAATPAYNFLNDNDNGMFRATTNTIGFSTAGTERMRIDSSGHVLPATDSTYNIGANANRFANGYFDTLYGDGSNLTGITGITINSNANNRVITATGNANSLNGESTLTFDGSTLDINGGSNDTPLILDTSNTAGSHLRFRKDGSNKHFIGCGGGFSLGDVDDLALRTTDNIIFGVSTSEKMRITSDGRVFIGSSNPAASANADDLCIGNNDGSAESGITLGSNTASSIRWADGGNNSAAVIEFEHGSTNALKFMSEGTEHMRLNSSGQLGINTTSPQAKLNILDTSNDGAISQLLKLGNNSSGAGTGAGLQLGAGLGNAGNSVLLSGFYDGTGTSFTIQTCNTFNSSQSEKLRITNDGKVGIGISSPTATLHVSGDYRSTGRLGVGTAATHANIVSYITGTGSYPPSGGLVQADNADSTAMFWNGSNSANYTGLSIECRTTGAAYWMIANVYNSSFSGDLAFRTRTGGSTNGEKVRFRREGGITFNGDTAAANALDDYEEGTFTPMSSTEASVYHARYTRIGNLCTINCNFEMKSGQSRDNISLPFEPQDDGAGKNTTNNSTTLNRYAGTCAFFDGGTSVVNLMLFHQGNQGAAAFFLGQTSGGAQQWPKTIDDSEFGQVSVSFTYQVK